MLRPEAVSSLGSEWPASLQRGARLLPVYTRASVAKKRMKEKQFYMQLTYPSCGVLACVAMRSGTSHKLQNRDGIKFWFEQLVDYGVGTKQDEDELRSKRWVRTSLS